MDRRRQWEEGEAKARTLRRRPPPDAETAKRLRVGRHAIGRRTLEKLAAGRRLAELAAESGWTVWDLLSWAALAAGVQRRRAPVHRRPPARSSAPPAELAGHVRGAGGPGGGPDGPGPLRRAAAGGGRAAGKAEEGEDVPERGAGDLFAAWAEQAPTRATAH